MSTEKARPIGFLRNKTSKNGNDFLKGMVELKGEKIEVVVFKNSKKYSENSPDYSIYVSQPLATSNNGENKPNSRVSNKPHVEDDDEDGLF